MRMIEFQARCDQATKSATTLIIDEIGYLPIDRQGANLFFQLVSRRYERGSIVITSNQSVGSWEEVFGDPVIASALIEGTPQGCYDWVKSSVGC
jgi:DNA replication protein DnaC